MPCMQYMHCIAPQNSTSWIGRDVEMELGSTSGSIENPLSGLLLFKHRGFLYQNDIQHLKLDTGL